MYNFDSYNVLLSIATNIPVLLMTAFVLQGHILVMHDIIGPILESADNGLKCKYQLKFRSYSLHE